MATGTFKTRLHSDSFEHSRFELLDADGKEIVTVWTEASNVNRLNDAFATFAEMNDIPFEKSKPLYIHPYPPDGP